MADTDLLFQQGPLLGSPVDLVFGDDGGEIPAVDAHVAGFITFRRPGPTGLVRLGIKAAGAITFVRPGAVGVVRYNSDTDRPLVGGALTFFQDGVDQQTDLRGIYQDGVHTPSGPRVRFQDGARMQDSQPVVFEDALRFHNDHATGFQDGVPLGDSAGQTFQDADRLRGDHRSGFKDGVKLRWASLSLFQDGLRGSRRFATTRFQDAVPHIVILDDGFGIGAPLWAYQERGRFQDAMRPPPGRSWYPPEPPEPEPCYDPSTDLVFDLRWVASADLLFACDYTEDPEQPGALIVVPTRDVYMTLNAVTLKRLSDNLILPAQGIELSIDADSYTWGWSASFAGAEEVALVETALAPDTGDPVEVELSINGQAIRLLTDPISRDRRFARKTLRVPGRGLAAELDAPSAPQMVFSQASDRTAAQLAEEALQVNGVGIGWGVDWQLTDWYVPGGNWSHQGTHISAVMEIAAAAGGYVQPHMTSRTLRILPRYPAAPWDWPDMEPDIELPVAPVTVEGIEWVRMPAYNRVYVFQEGGSVRGRVTRAGTDGATEAPQIAHPLITAGDAVLQAGTAALSNTGKQAMVSLRLPVLEETGLILPGKLVRYVDGSKTRLGLVRSTSVSWERPVLRQTIKLETHILEAA